MEMKGSDREKLSAIGNSAAESENKKAADRQSVIYQKQREFQVWLREILLTYPNLRADDICFAAPVYYLIALIELMMEEEIFEEFDSFEQDLMQFVEEIGANPEALATVMGLEPSFIRKLMRSLAGRGFLTEDGLTEIGRESLERGARISTKTVGQVFQMDAIHLRLLRFEELVDEDELSKRRETDRNCGLLSCWEGISKQEMDQQLAEIPKDDFLRTKSMIFPPNIREITSQKCKGLRFAKGCMLGLRYTIGNKRKERAVIFGKRRMRMTDRGKEGKRCNVWLPFSLPNKTMLEWCRFSEEIVVGYSDLVRVFYRKACEKQVENTKHDENADRYQITAEKYRNYLKNNHIDIDSHIEIDYILGDGIYRGMHVKLFMDTRINRPAGLLNLMQNLSARGADIYARFDWKGGIILFETLDEEFKHLADIIREVISVYSYEKVKQYLDDMMPYEKGDESYAYCFGDIAAMLESDPIAKHVDRG